MFRLGMCAYAIHRNNYMPFVNGAIFASMETVQPQWIDAHEAFYSLRLYNIYRLSGGVLKMPVTNFLRFAYAYILKQVDGFNLNIILTTTIEYGRCFQFNPMDTSDG